MGTLPKQTKRRALIKRLKELGWDGPYCGAKGRAGDHPEYMAWTNPKDPHDQKTVKLPNPHSGRDVGEGLLKMILAEAGLTASAWLGDGKADSGPASE